LIFLKKADMGYRSNYKKPAYEFHGLKWDKFEEKIKFIKVFISQIEYDGYNKNINESIKDINEYISIAINTIKENQFSKLFILPTEYEIKDFISTCEITPPPDLPTMPPAPQSILFEGEYPSGYAEHGIIERWENNRKNLLIESVKINELIENKRQEFKNIHEQLKNKIELIKKGTSLLSANIVENENLIIHEHNSHFLPKFLRRNYICRIDKESRLLIIQFEFPDYSNENIISGYRKVKYTEIAKYYSEAQKKKLVKNCLYSLIIRSAVIASKFNPCNLYDSVVVNVEQNWFDPATGQPRSGVIATLQATNEYLNSLDLTKLDPESCFKFLKGISTQNVLNSTPVRPIFILNKEDERFVENKSIAIADEENLAAMDWEDFEHLVAQLFEWEFAKNGIEVKVTRASRDRGVDAILFDPDPLRGGKYVLQAKRYTRTVDVSAVRDLYGTIMNEGANRGIIITTASFGPDAYEFSKDKPISLVDGQNLLLMLQKHGKKFRIDLEEARQLNIENQK